MSLFMNRGMKRRHLRLEQRFMNSLQSQAATITGVSGETLQQSLSPLLRLGYNGVRVGETLIGLWYRIVLDDIHSIGQQQGGARTLASTLPNYVRCHTTDLMCFVHTSPFLLAVFQLR